MAKKKKLENEGELLKEGIRLGMEYGEIRVLWSLNPLILPMKKLNISIDCWYTIS